MMASLQVGLPLWKNAEEAGVPIGIERLGGEDVYELKRIAELLGEWNRVGREIADLIGRPTEKGHVGEFIAARIFQLQLHGSAVAAGSDGHFTEGPLAGCSVNVKWYAKREGLLDLSTGQVPDYYLVLAGPAATASSSRGTDRAWVIESVHLFRADRLHEQLAARNVKIGVAASVRRELWEAAEIYPRDHQEFPLSREQRRALSWFR